MKITNRSYSTKPVKIYHLDGPGNQSVLFAIQNSNQTQGSQGLTDYSQGSLRGHRPSYDMVYNAVSATSSG